MDRGGSDVTLDYARANSSMLVCNTNRVSSRRATVCLRRVSVSSNRACCFLNARLSSLTSSEADRLQWIVVSWNGLGDSAIGSLASCVGVSESCLRSAADATTMP